MTRLAYDICRCAGQDCDRRRSCARYMSLQTSSIGHRTHCGMNLCSSGHDSFIEYVGEALRVEQVAQPLES